MRTTHSLPLFHRIAGQQVLVLGDGPSAEAKRRLVMRAGGVVAEDLPRAIDEGVRLAFIAYEDQRACEVAAINARCAGMLVNVVDRPELCDFTTPAIVDRDPVLVAIGTGGASAGLAKQLRLRLERLLPASLGALARALATARPVLAARLPDAAARRRALDLALGEGGVLDPLDPHAHERALAWAEGALGGEDGVPGLAPLPGETVTLTLTSADPEDLTLRQARLLGMADCLLLDGAVPAALLARARADARRLALGPDEDPPAEAAGQGLTLVLRWRPAPGANRDEGAA